jgi:hypothetical protein
MFDFAIAVFQYIHCDEVLQESTHSFVQVGAVSSAS